MAAPQGFEWSQRKNGDIEVSHRGRLATTLRGRLAAEFLDAIETDDEQELLARLTGNYRRGNEREARNHPRNRDR